MKSNNISLSMLHESLSIQLPSAEVNFTPLWSGAEQVNLSVKRDDDIHPIISGNKWRKLEQALIHYLNASQPKSGIISFGGGYSNHIHALGYCCYKLQIPFMPIIRGEYSSRETPMLSDIIKWGAQPNYVDKITYKKRNDPDYLNLLKKHHPNWAIVPEGGSQSHALAGVAKVIDELSQHYDYILAPVASGATLAGLITSCGPSTQVIGIGVLKGQGYLEQLVEQFLPLSIEKNWQILHQFHHGGYAKSSDELDKFCEQFNANHHFDIEPIYSGKLFYACNKLLEQGYFKPSSRVLLVHTGGLQGAR